MSQRMLSFMNSPYFVPEPDNWHLTEDAPEEVRKEFEEFIKEEAEKKERSVV